MIVGFELKWWYLSFKIFFDKLSNLFIWLIFLIDFVIVLFLYEWGNVIYKIYIKYGYKFFVL